MFIPIQERCITFSIIKSRLIVALDTFAAILPITHL